MTRRDLKHRFDALGEIKFDVLIASLKTFPISMRKSFRIFFFLPIITKPFYGLKGKRKSFRSRITHPDVEEAFISGHDNLRLQKARGGLSNGACWTGDRLCRKEPCLGEIMLSMPLEDVRRRDPGSGAVADGEGTFYRCERRIRQNVKIEAKKPPREACKSFNHLPL